MYVINNICEIVGEVRNTESPVSWLEFLPASKQLFDSTNDPDNPVELTYNKNRFGEYDFNKICGSNRIVENNIK